MRRSHLIDRLAKADEPSVQWKVGVSTGKKTPAEWIAADALRVLHAAGRA